MIRNWLEAMHKSRTVRNRLRMIWLFYKVYDCGECAEILDVCPSLQLHTITNYKRLYREGSLERLCRLDYRKPESELAPYAATISDFTRYTVPESIAEIRQFIIAHLGIEKGLQQVRFIVKKLGFRYRKTTPFPGGKDPEKLLEQQTVFKEDVLFPLLKKAAVGTVDILFMDVAHFVQATMAVGNFCRQM